MRTDATSAESRRAMRRRVAVLGAIVAVFAIGLAVVDPPGVQEVLAPLDADSATAGRQYKYLCQIPRGIGDGLGGRVGISSWQPSRDRAKASAIARAVRGRARAVGPDWVYGTWDLYVNGQHIYTVLPRCKVSSTRYVP